MIKVLVVDDSAVIRQLLSEMIDAQPDMEVVGTAADPFIARDKIKRLNPDVITLDVEMPRMDGVTFLRNLMRLRPLPVLMISTLTDAGADVTLEALDVGAFDYVTKPKVGSDSSLRDYQELIADKLRAAAAVDVAKLERASSALTRTTVIPKRSPAKTNYQPKTGALVAIGASTGGTEAIKDVLQDLPENFAPIVIAQHIPPQFSKSYAQRLDRLCAMRVFEAEHDQPVEQGCAYVAPGDFQMGLRNRGGRWFIHCEQSEKVNRHRPSVEYLFDSLLDQNIRCSAAALLTGMGADGAEALKRLKDAGYHTLVQDEESSVVWGMPGSAYKLDAHCEMLGLRDVANRLINLTSGR